MTAIYLIKAVAEAVREVVKDFELIAELQPPKPVTVYEQYLPTDRFEDDTFYPLVIVSCRNIEFDADTKFDGDRVATILLTIGVYGGDKEDGWRDLFNLAERISQFLFSTPILDKKFLLDFQPEFEPLPEQPEPFYFGNILVKYKLGTPRF